MKKRNIAVAVLLLWFAACGGVTNATNPQPAPTPEPTQQPAPGEEAPPYTAMLASDAAIPSGNMAVVFNANWADPIGNLATIGLADPATASLARITSDGSDAVVRSFGNRIYVINRWGTDTIQVIDPASFGVIANFSVGSGSNPQDIAAVSDEKAYISRLDAQSDAATTDDILIVNPLTGDVLGSIDLTPYTADDGDRLARAAQMVLVDGRLYVCLQDLPANLMNPANTNGKVAVIDTETDTVIDVDPDLDGTQAIELAGMNPSDITYSPLTEKFYVASTGKRVAFVVDVSDATGGIESFHLDDDEQYVSEGIVIDDAAFGADVTEVRLASAELGFTIVGSTAIAAFDPTTFAVVDPNVYQTPGFFLPDFSIDQDGRLLVAEQDFMGPGVVFLNADGTKVAGPTAVGAPPSSITFVDQ